MLGRPQYFEIKKPHKLNWEKADAHNQLRALGPNFCQYVHYLLKFRILGSTKYSKVWNKRTPLNKRTPWKKSGKRINVPPLDMHKHLVFNKTVPPGKKSRN